MKKALILLIAILSFAIMFAVPLNEGLEGTTLPLEGMVQIGNEENTDLYLPLTTNFGYNYSQTIYLQSEINAPGQRIEKLYYQWNGFEAATYCNDWEIYIGHTNKTAFSSNSDWIPLANLTQVFNGVVNTPATPGWIEIVLTTPINFNNTDNLVIAVNETTPGRGCTAAAFYGTSFDTNRGLRVWNDSSAYNPASPDAGYLVAGIANIKIQFGDIPAAPIFSHSPASIAFALTKAGESSDAQNVTVTNTCGGTLTLSATDVSLAGTNALDFSFSAANLPTNLTASQSVTIPVSFTPQSAGEKTATLVINYDSVNYEVLLTGTAYPETFGFEGFEGASFPPMGWANLGVWTRSTYSPYSGTGSAYGYGTSSPPYILSTPKLEINSGDILSFMTKISSTVTTLEILYSQNRTDWSLLETLTAPTSNTWSQFIVDLTPILDTKVAEGCYLGFLANTFSVSYYLDDVIMPPLVHEAPEAVTLSAPAYAATNLPTFTTLGWIPSTTGGIPTSYDVYLDTLNGSTLVSNDQASTTYSPTLNYNTTYYWKVVASNAYGNSPASAVWRFTTMDDASITAFPWTESFDGTTFAPIGWLNVRTAGTGTPGIWDRQTSDTYPTASPHSGAAMARYNCYNLYSGAKGELSTPPVIHPQWSSIHSQILDV